MTEAPRQGRGLFFVTPGQGPFVTGSSMGLGIRVEGLRLLLIFPASLLMLKLSRFSISDEGFFVF